MLKVPTERLISCRKTNYKLDHWDFLLLMVLCRVGNEFLTSNSVYAQANERLLYIATGQRPWMGTFPTYHIHVFAGVSGYISTV